MFIAKVLVPRRSPLSAWQPAIGWTDIHSTLDPIDHMVSDAAEVHPPAPRRKPQDAETQETQMRIAYLGSSLRLMIAAAR